MTLPEFKYSKPEPESDWPESWDLSYFYDCLEIWGKEDYSGYVSGYKNRQKMALSALQKHTPAKGKVLDLAAAQGNFSIAAAQLGYQVTWNDLRDDLIDYVRLKLPDAFDLDFISGNIFEIDDSYEGIFDTVMAFEIIEHVAHPDEFLHSISKLIKPGGRIIISTPNGGYFRNPLPRFSDFPDPSVFESEQFKPDSDGHIFLLHQDEIESLSNKAGLLIEYFHLLTNPLTAGHIKLRYLHRILPKVMIDWIEQLSAKLPMFLRRRIQSSTLVVLKKA